MMNRNRKMIEPVDLLIAVYNQSGHGRTFNTIQYAKKLNKEIFIINPQDF